MKPDPHTAGTGLVVVQMMGLGFVAINGHGHISMPSENHVYISEVI